MNLERLRQRFFEGLTRYRWQETVGRGGMGIVFKAQDLDLDDVVAIKVLSPDWETDDQQLLQRFKREINLNRKIKHPNVARIHDFGMSNDFPYITMEYVPGKDLRTIIQIEGKLPQARAISILRQIALGTEAAHKLGIIHRDLKSQNVMVEDSGAVAILDFGLARGKTTEQLTLDSVMVGTPHYMSPEQALGRPTDARSDVYSIGVMAYEILTGKVPFRRRVAARDRDEARLGAAAGRPAQGDGRHARAHRDHVQGPREGTGVPVRLPRPISRPSSRCFAPSSPAPCRRCRRRTRPFRPSRFRALPGCRSRRPRAGERIPSSLRCRRPPCRRPRCRPPRAATPVEAKKRPPVILLVEGDAKERKRLADVLGRHGCRTLEAKDGPEALGRLLKDTVDLVLMDISLPGMDGFDVTRVIKAQPATIALPVVLTSARLDRSHFAFAIQTGATDVMAKPLQSEAVVGRLWHILTHHGFQPPAGNEPVLAAMKKTLPSAMTPPSAPGKSSR